MYVGTHYNSYYSSRFGNISSVYGQSAQVGKAADAQNALSSLSVGGTSLYNQSAFSSSALKYAQTVKTSGTELSSTLKGLSDGSAFSRKGMVSGDSSAMTVKSSGAKYTSGKTAQSVEIDQVAAAQVNTGAALNAKANAGVSGYQQLAVEVGGKTSQISFRLSSADSNADAQQKMADAINAKGLGIKASVVQDSKNGTSQLKLEGAETGSAKGGFQIRNVSGNAFEAMGIGNVTQQAQDAVYRLDGGAARTSASNTVDIGGGVSATFKKASQGAVSVKQGTDTQAAVDKVEDMVSQYNKLYGAAMGNETDAKANRLLTDLVSTSRTYQGQLEEIGVGFDQNGYMTMDKDKLAAAAENGSLEQFFTQDAGKSYGFSNRLNAVADRAGNNTSQYVSQSSFTQSLGGYSGAGSLASNSYMNSISVLTNSLLGGSGGTSYNSGWMFDFML